MIKPSNAFTLLEMLIVLGIIAIIISVASVSYSTAQKKSRDARRKSDLRQIQSSMEQYYSLCGYQYPVGSAQMVPTIGCTSPATVILPVIPIDPRASPYPMPTSDTSTYQICTTLEIETPSTYCLTNQQ